jgi:transforming growth factor-beta-induced protein
LPSFPLYTKQTNKQTKTAKTICGADAFTVLCGAIQSTGIFDALDDLNSQWTVFVPPDDAFTALADVIATLTNQQLADILLYHAVEGIVTFNDLKCDQWVYMANGKPSFTLCRGVDKIQLGPGNGPSKLNTEPKIVAKDIAACNGLLHAVENVLLPE